jgi:hypothetical protein
MQQIQYYVGLKGTIYVHEWFSLHNTYTKANRELLYDEFWSRTFQHSVGPKFTIEYRYLGEFEPEVKNILGC